jgi:hypothetical protein
MTHDMLDADDLGRRINGMLPWPLNRRITAEQAAKTIADGITNRAVTTMAPTGWQLYSVLRGAANPVIDHLLARDKRMRKLTSDIEKVKSH